MMVLRLQNPAALRLPGMRVFLRQMPVGQADIEAVLAELAEAVDRPNVGLFVAFGEDLQPAAGILVALPTSALDPMPQVIALWAHSPNARKAVIEAGVKYVQEAGYNKVRAVNETGRPDGVAARLYNVGEARTVGSMMEFTLR